LVKKKANNKEFHSETHLKTQGDPSSQKKYKKKVKSANICFSETIKNFISNSPVDPRKTLTKKEQNIKIYNASVKNK
jgi:hypothetical protein